MADKRRLHLIDVSNAGARGCGDVIPTTADGQVRQGWIAEAAFRGTSSVLVRAMNDVYGRGGNSGEEASRSTEQEVLPPTSQSLRALVSKGRKTRWLLRIVEARTHEPVCRLCASQCSGLRSSSSCGKERIRHALHVSVCDGTRRKRTTGNSKEELRHHRGRRWGCSRLGRCPWAGRRGSPRRVPGERRRRGQQARRNRRRRGERADGLLS